MEIALLVTDDVRRSQAVAEALGEVAECRVVHVCEPWQGMPGVAGVVADVDIRHEASARALCEFTRLHGRFGPPLIYLLRGAPGRGLVEAERLGVTLCLPGRSPPRAIAAALVAQTQQGRPSSPDGVLHQGVQRSGEALRSVFERARADGCYDAAAMEAGVAPLVDAVKAGGLKRWLDTVWAHDDVTFQHCLLVAGLAAHVALHLRFPDEDQRRFARAALVHDVGKARIPLSILNKPGHLDRDEQAVMRNHAALGYDMLVEGGCREPLTLDIVRHHHEMLDGSGYPDGLARDQIGDAVRMMTVCDIYAALVEHRPYRPPMTPGQALGVLRSMEWRLDQSMVEAFAEAVLDGGPSAG